MEGSNAPGTATSAAGPPELITSSLQVDAHVRIPLYRAPSALTGIPDPPEALDAAPEPAPVTQDESWPEPSTYTAQELPGTSSGRVRGLPWRTIALVVAVIVVAIPIAYYSVGALNVDADTSLAQRALQSGASHSGQIAEAFIGPTAPTGLSPTRQNIAVLRQVLTDYAASLSDVGSRLDSDTAALTFVQNSLKTDSANPLLWNDRSKFAHDQRRVAALLEALQSARSGMRIIQGQVTTYVALFDVLDGYVALVPYLDSQDVNGALAHYSTLDQNMQVLVASTNSAKFSPHFIVAVNHLKALTADLETLLAAIQYRNAGVFQVLRPKVKADADALSSDNVSDMALFEQNLLVPYIDGYNSGVKAAGFNQLVAPRNL
jgi:hypothetical protein